MISKRFKILIITNLFLFNLFGQHYDFVKILSGEGIVYNNDTIFLNKTTVQELHQKLGIKDTLPPGTYRGIHWSGIDPETGMLTGGHEYIREVEFKSITFYFADENDKDNLKLRSITICEDETIKTYTDNGLMIGMINPDLKEIFPDLGDYFSNDRLTYFLYSYGISFELKKMENGDLRVIEIVVAYQKRE